MESRSKAPLLVTPFWLARSGRAMKWRIVAARRIRPTLQVINLTMHSVRKKTEKTLGEYGVRVSPSLPVLEDGLRVRRNRSEIFERMLGIYCVVVTSFDPSRRGVVGGWMSRCDVRVMLTDDEARFLQGDARKVSAMQWEVESLFALSWACGLSGAYSALSLCPDDLYRNFPSIKNNESPTELERAVSLREQSDLVAALDIYYCLQWHLRDSMMHGRQANGPLGMLGVVGRRRAIEWLLRSDDWCDITLDT